MSSEHANGLEGDSLANLNAGPAKKAACDRCRGQKLRCEWDADGPGQRCRRCTKAAAVCYIPPPRPLGRPRGNGTAKRGSDVRSQLIVLPASIPLSSSKALPANAPGDERLDEEDDERDSLDRLVDSFSAPPFSFEDLESVESRMVCAAMPQVPNHPLPMNREARSGTAAPGPAHDDPIPSSGSVPPCVQPNPLERSDDDFSSAPSEAIDRLARLDTTLHRHLEHVILRSDKPSSEPGAAPLARPTCVTASSLGLGRLLSITQEFKAVIDQLGIRLASIIEQITGCNGADPAAATVNGHTRAPFDHSTAMLTLTCYLRLKEAHTQTLRVLRRMDEDQVNGNIDAPEFMSDLVVDGFPVAGHCKLQLGIALQLCEHEFNSVGPVPGLDDGFSSLGQDNVAVCIFEKLGLLT